MPVLFATAGYRLVTACLGLTVEEPFKETAFPLELRSRFMQISVVSGLGVG